VKTTPSVTKTTPAASQTIGGVSGARACGGGGGSGAGVVYYFANDSSAVAYASGPQGSYTLQPNGGSAQVTTTIGANWSITGASGASLGCYTITGSGQITVT
jgi:hypothetical protein